AGTVLWGVHELCAPRVHNRSPAPALALTSPVPALSSSPPASVPFSPAGAGIHGSTSSNRLFFSIRETAAPETRQTISGSPAASTAPPALRTNSDRARQSGYLSPPLLRCSQAKISSIL